MQISYLIIVFLIHINEFFLNLTNCEPVNTENNQILLIISYDGFRNEYLQRNVTPNLLQLRKDGVYTDYMTNVFPTKTFTNHFSIATGLYPDLHGVLANSLYDTKQGALTYGYDLFHYDPDILPIWIVNQNLGGSSGCMMWPGSNFEYGNTTCEYIQEYNSSISLTERVDTIMSWLTTTENPPNLIMFYSEQPDKLAHIVGPDSKNITDMVAELDLLTKYIQDQLVENNLINRTNVIHLSDHGMASVQPPRFINLSEFLEPDTVQFHGASPVLQIVLNDTSQFDDVYNRLMKAANATGAFKIYTNEKVLARWHVKNYRRFGPIVAVAEYGYAFQDMWYMADHYKRNFNINITENSTYGVHGYDNDYELMHSYFIAKGPKFKIDTKIEPFESVDLFSLFTKILQFDEQIERNGKYERVSNLLQETQEGISWTNILMIVCLCAIIISIILIYVVHQYRRRQNYNVSY